MQARRMEQAQGRPPVGVINADHDRACLEDQRRSEARAINESGRCSHEKVTIARTMGDDLSDHETQWAHCHSCEAWIVRTVWYNKPQNECIEDRPMTEAESERLAVYETRRSRSEWLHDHQAGVR